MSRKQYVKNLLPTFMVNFIGMLALTLFLLASGNSIDTVILVLVVWSVVLLIYIAISCSLRKRYIEKLLSMTEQLEDRYLIAELMDEPVRADDQGFYQILKMAEKSMLERVGIIQQDRKEYREYIEQWVHEVKTPITAMKLLCENKHSDYTRELLVELEKINRFTEQALYYARSEHTEKDYSIREVQLEDVVHEAIADNKYLLRQNHITIDVADVDDVVYTDDKWVRFILNQLISNAVKYRTEHPVLLFRTERQDDQVHLFVEDNGIGISESDLPRIFEKGFTGQNGRMIQSSTGIGLYLCKRLCGKLGIGLEVHSEGSGTSIVLSFHVNHFIVQVQG